MAKAILALFAIAAFHTGMMKDRANLCGNDATAFAECSK